MNKAVAAGKESLDPRLQDRQEIVARARGTWLDRFETWVNTNSGWLAMAVITAAFALRVYYAASCYLNPDEAQHFNAARPDSWHGALDASVKLAHPPLFILVLHAFLFLGRSEVILRLPSLVAGTAALWLTFAWIRRTLGEIPALGGLLFMAVSHASVSASTEVRQYGLLLCFTCGALYATERALAEMSARWTIVQGLCVLGAVLTHFSAPVAIVCVDIYFLLRCQSKRVPLRIQLTFVTAQVVVGVIFAWLYVRMSAYSQIFDLTYLNSYFLRPSETLIGFSKRAFIETFAYMVNRRWAYLIMVVFAAGLVAIVIKRTKAPRPMALVIVSPFAIGLLAAVMHKLPFAGSRHQTYMLPFLAAGLAAAITWIPRRLAAPLLCLVTLLAFSWAIRNPPDNNPRSMAIGEMTAAVDYIDRSVPQSAALCVDNSSLYVIWYYLGRNDSSLDSTLPLETRQVIGGRRIVSLPRRIWSFDPDSAILQANAAASAAGFSGKPLWIFSVGWLDPPLTSRLHGGRVLSARDFGTVSVIEAARE